ncbi:glycosyltransferase [candidate division KSB1 bacterium]|nr:glycosyltransferase [candidate division KSB1 bacterium]NIT73415.1 glycosyltransferase [candidate division KSB1 bacterium]NIX73095.1 glycosyltransferase [candidate division KSB1 bacterium]
MTYTKPMDGKMREKVAPAKVRTSVIVYVHNFDREISAVSQTLKSGFEEITEDFEIIFVDDGSIDGTWQELKKIAQDDRRIKLIRLRTEFGESASFDAGIKQATGDRVVFFTIRVRINAAQISKLIARLDDGFDLVMGWRHPRRDSGLNQFISKTFNRIVRWISKISLHDINSGVFAARKELLQDLPLYGNLNIFLPILASRRGYRVSDEPIEQLPGKFRQSKYVSEYIQRLLDIVTVVFLTNYSKKPLHFLGFLGLIFTMLGAGMNLYLFIYRIFQFGPIAGRPLLLLGALLLVIGIQMISIGLIGEMIIFTHAKDIKEYTIEEILE